MLGSLILTDWGKFSILLIRNAGQDESEAADSLSNVEYKRLLLAPHQIYVCYVRLLGLVGGVVVLMSPSWSLIGLAEYALIDAFLVLVFQ